MGFTELVAQADRAVLGHLGPVTVRYSSASYGTVDVQGIFDERFVLVDDARAGVETVTPAVWLKLADLPDLPVEDDPLITIDGETYRVRERQTDGDVGGSVLLLLHRAE